MAHWSPGAGLSVRGRCCPLGWPSVGVVVAFTMECTGSNGNVRTFPLLSLVYLARVPSQASPVCGPGCVSALYHLLGSTPPDQPNTQSQKIM